MVIWDYYVATLLPSSLILEAHRNISKSQLLRKMNFDELSEEHRFTKLHKIVCGIDLHDLDLEVQRRPHEVDKLDGYGRSPLWYAVSHGDTQFVRLLLERGANPNLCGSAIIVHAIKWAQVETVELLITIGFSITDLDIEDLLEALEDCYLVTLDYLLHDCWAIESLIIRHWVDVNRQTTHGITLLMFLCSHSYSGPDGPSQLIRRGAQLELRNSNGETALIHCIKGSFGLNPDAFQTLVRAGARLDVQDYTGATILHHVVLLEGYKECELTPLIKAMQDVDVSQFDLNARDEDGYTAFDLLKKRNGITWESYYLVRRGQRWEAYDEYEIPTIRGLESLFHQIQDSQGIPLEQQYPTLADYLCEQTDDEPIPGAWPL